MWLFNRLAVRRAGGKAVRLVPGRANPLDMLDGVVIGGGDDINPSLYGGELALSVRIDHERDRLEREIVEHARLRELPVLGICRGAQMINIVRGGTLHPDIASHEQAPPVRTILPRKRVRISSGSRLREIVGISTCRVNALHHQSADRPGEGLAIVARDEHGIVQAVEDSSGKFLLGVQWHPEFLLLDRHQQALFGALVATARAARRMSASSGS